MSDRIVQPEPQQAQAERAARLPILSVGELTGLIKNTLRSAPRLREVWVEGEVGQVSISAAGHCYFTLKDERAQLKCVIFRDERLMMPFEARTGLRLIAQGSIDVFEPQGAYQLYVKSIQPSGFGDLALQFEALKAKLAAEGLFEQARKRPLPVMPQNIGVVTSLSGAVLHDIRRVLARRWPMARVVVSACQVQGQGAAATIVAALRRVARWIDDESGRATDVVILARGGGSLEDLWPFNDESVVRAVAAHPCPIVVGVGHETDVTLAEFAADVRAATPSVAAELIVPSRTDELARVGQVGQRLNAALARSLGERRQQLNTETRALEARHPQAQITADRERVGVLLDRAARVLARRLEIERTTLARAADDLPALAAGAIGVARAEFARSSAALSALSPFATLERGYSIVRGADGAVLRDAGKVRKGDPVSVRLQRGELGARVETVRDSTP
ncbi:MAG TPA: exodeoxyribonuclease VII large subunit [Candidatus Limnocylindrales bacterium]|nr:exodeoxyribonuclease VII large subunit [Candidatus Limnocylindrales bacterium]